MKIEILWRKKGGGNRILWIKNGGNGIVGINPFLFNGTGADLGSGGEKKWILGEFEIPSPRRRPLRLPRAAVGMKS